MEALLGDQLQDHLKLAIMSVSSSQFRGIYL